MANLSGGAYIAARIRTPETDDEKGLRKIVIASEKNCDHTKTICMSTKCVEWWSFDYELLLQRTGAGRRFAKALKL